MTYVGIDYGCGITNIDVATGIRYGVISQHDVFQAWADSSEADYGDPTCPKCGEKPQEYDAALDDDWDCARHECAEFMCTRCEYVFSSESAFGDEPNGYFYSGDGYEMVDCLYSDIMILKSSFYTFTRLCSPCVPGAGDLNNPLEGGAKAYCLGHDWFDEGKAPYPVYTVNGDIEVLPSDPI